MQERNSDGKRGIEERFPSRREEGGAVLPKKQFELNLRKCPSVRKGDINALSYELRQIEINATYFQAPRPEAKQNNCVYFGD